MARSPAAPTLEEIVASIPAWRGQEVEATPISGGITNRALQLRVGGTPYFVSIPGAHSHLLAIPRAQEVENARRAAAVGISPQVVHYLPDSGVMVVEWLEGRTLGVGDMHSPELVARVAAAARQLHRARPFANDFDLFRLAREYRQLLSREKMQPPVGYDGYRPLWRELEAAANARREPTRACSNDLVPQNVIDDGQRLWIIDFGYSGNNDPCSELGNAAAEWVLNHDEMEGLCAAYFGAAEARRLARMQLYALLSDAAWSLWSVIQERLSDLDFDFTGYGAERWNRARARLDSDDLPIWMRQAA